MKMRKLLLGLTTLFAVTTLGACSNNNFDNEKLVVGLECDYSPFNWTATEESEYTMKIELINDGPFTILLDSSELKMNV